MKASMVGSILLSAALAALAGCGRDDAGAGPAERVGKAIDHAGSKVTNSVQDELAKVDRATEAARDKVKDATRNASRGLDRATDQVGKQVERVGEKMQKN
jgi:conjugal transfer/entry exclusion protein